MLEKDGFTFDLNKMTRREFREFFLKLDAAKTGLDRDEVTGQILQKVCMSWPFPDPITIEGYLGLGLLDSKKVDEVLEWVLVNGGQKN